jgi:hypothetical protein
VVKVILPFLVTVKYVLKHSRMDLKQEADLSLLIGVHHWSKVFPASIAF